MIQEIPNQENLTFNAVTPVGPKHKKIATKTIQSLCRFSGASRIFVITSRDNFGFFRRRENRCERPISLVDENSVIEGLNLGHLQHYLTHKISDSYAAGWYFQQFLKMAACQLPDIGEYYLIWDSDTILLRPMIFFDRQGRVLVNPKTEFHEPYFRLTKRLLGWDRGVDFSFISEHFMVKTEYMQDLISAISGEFPGERSWVYAVMDSIGLEDLNRCGFSEYETYGNYIHFNYPDSYRCRHVKAWRNAASHFGLCPSRFDIHVLSKDYVFASFESRGHRLSVMLRKMISVLIYCYDRLVAPRWRTS